MKKIIHHLRNQSEETRTHILHVLTVGASVILVLLWIYSLGTNLTNTDTKTQISKDLKPFSVLKDNLVGGYKSISQPEEQIDTSVLDN